MNTNVMLSGLPEDACRQLLGEAAWAIAGPCWRAPGALHAASVPDGTSIAWLFRSPVDEVLVAGDPDDPAALLDRWTQAQRGALNLRRNPRLQLLVVDASGPVDGLAHAWPALAPLLPERFPSPPFDPAVARATAWLVERIAPETAEVHGLLEGLAVNARPGPDAGDAMPAAAERDALASLLGLLLDRSREAAVATAAAGDQALRADLLARQLHQVRDELDLNFQRARALEDDAAEAQALRQRLRRIEQHDQQLAFQLQFRLEELLAAHEGLRQQMESQYRAWQGSLEVLEAERTRRQALEDEHRALHMKLELLQEQLRLATLPPAEPEAGRGRLRRRLDGLRRKVRSSVRTQAPAANAGEDRQQAINELSQSRWFDPDWYSRRYADVGLLGIDPAQHYHDHGWVEGRDPGPEFSTRFYLEMYPDVADSKMVPLLHFVRFGLREGRLPRSPAAWPETSAKQ